MSTAKDGAAERDARDEAARDYRSAFVCVKRLWPFTRPYLRYVWLILAFTILGAPLAVVSPLIIKAVIDAASGEVPGDEITKWALILVGMTAVSVAFGIIIGYSSHLFHAKVTYRVRLRLYRHLQRLSMGYHQRHETGFLMSRLNDDVNNLGGVMADALGKAVIEGGKAIAFLVMLFHLEVRLAAGGCVLVAVVFAVQLLISPALRRRNRELQERRTALSETMHQGVSGHALVVGTASEPREARRFATSLGAFTRAAVRRDLFSLWANHAMFLITGVAPTLIILGGAFLIVEDELSVGGLFAFFMYLVQMAGSVAEVARLNPAMQASAASVQRIFEILDTVPDVAEADDPVDPGRVRGAVRFEGVGFAYEEGLPVLDAIDLDVAPDTVVAIVGPSGAGKSTLVNLVPRFHDPVAGRVLVDGRDVRALDLRAYREQVGVVPQEVFLFDRSVRDNIAFGVPDATDAAIRAAADAAHATGFIEAMPKGFDTVIGERGVRLSGGQRQRIAIAREILRNPPILILDEATSSLDTESERLIQRALETLLEGRTSFVIAHRLSTVLNADIIVVMDEGRVVERGTHAELLSADGLYARLFRTQAFTVSGEDTA